MSVMSEIVNPGADRAHYLADLERVLPSGPDWVSALRQTAAAQFANAEFPHRKMEQWRFTNVAPILRTSFRSLVSPRRDALTVHVERFRYSEPGWTELVFVDGFYAPSLSRIAGTITAKSLMSAVRDDDALARAHLNRYLNGTANAFTMLNSAFLLDGAFVHVPHDAIAEGPVHLLFVSTGEESDTAVYPRNLILIDRNAQVSIVESHVSLNARTRYLSNAVAEISVGDGANVTYHKLIAEADEAFHLATARVRLGRDSSYRSYTICQSGKIVRNEISTLLDGEGAHCSLNGLYMTAGDQLVDNPIAIEHAKPHCTSWIGYKGVLQDKSHAVFTGKVYVRRDAQKTDSNQLNQNLVLSDKATIDTKPQLEIFADDVKCTHGATVGPPPRELVFYFRTRGMSEATALAMLTYGFADEVVNQIEIGPVRKRLEDFVFNKYSPIPG